MRRVHQATVALLSVLLLAILMAGCGSQPSANTTSSPNNQKLSSTLNVFNWSDYLPQDVITSFQNKYHVKINYATYSSNSEMLSKIQAGGQHYDFAVASDYMVDTMAKLKLLDPLDHNVLTNLKNIDSKFLNPAYDPGNKYSIPYMWGTVMISVNTSKIHDKITSWNDLLKPEFKNSLVVLNSPRDMIGVALKACGYSMNDTDPGHLQQALAWLEKLKPNIKVFDSDSPKTELLNGECKAGIVYTGDAAMAYKANKAIVPVYPKEGVEVWVDNMVIPKGAQHQYTSEVFMNYLLRPEVSARISAAYPYGNPNAAAQKYIAQDLLTNPAVNPPAAVLASGEHLQNIGNGMDQFMQIWTKFKGQ